MKRSLFSFFLCHKLSKNFIWTTLFYFFKSIFFAILYSLFQVLCIKDVIYYILENMNRKNKKIQKYDIRNEKLDFKRIKSKK